LFRKTKDREKPRRKLSDWRKHKKSIFQIKYICQKLEQGKIGKYSLFDAWIPIKDAEAEIKRLKQEYARAILSLRREIKKIKGR
jgi:hypothetical protein